MFRVQFPMAKIDYFSENKDINIDIKTAVSVKNKYFYMKFKYEM